MVQVDIYGTFDTPNSECKECKRSSTTKWSVQEGGNAITAFTVWIRELAKKKTIKFGKDFLSFLKQLEDGPDGWYIDDPEQCLDIVTEMKDALPELGKHFNVDMKEFSSRVKMGTSWRNSDPDSLPEEKQWILYYLILMNILEHVGKYKGEFKQSF